MKNKKNFNFIKVEYMIALILFDLFESSMQLYAIEKNKNYLEMAFSKISIER